MRGLRRGLLVVVVAGEEEELDVVEGEDPEVGEDEAGAEVDQGEGDLLDKEFKDVCIFLSNKCSCEVKLFMKRLLLFDI